MKAKKYAVCVCGVEMKPGSRCKSDRLELNNGKLVRRHVNSSGGKCGDCNSAPGAYHHIGCDQAQCPLCGGQESFCDCPIKGYSVRVPVKVAKTAIEVTA